MESGVLDRSLASVDGDRRYRLYVPPGYTPARRWPVILFLHGSGEAGDDGRLPTEVGLGPAIRRDPDRFPAIVVFPQLRRDHRWSGADAADALAALAATERELATDLDRVLLTGLSRGGAGAGWLAYRDPGRFAALLLVCGPYSRSPILAGRAAPDPDPIVPPGDGEPFAALARRLRHLPIRVFHGDADPIVPVDESRRLVRALRDTGSSAGYTELPGVGHEAWDAVYGSAEVIAWLLAQRRPRR